MPFFRSIFIFTAALAVLFAVARISEVFAAIEPAPVAVTAPAAQTETTPATPASTPAPGDAATPATDATPAQPSTMPSTAPAQASTAAESASPTPAIKDETPGVSEAELKQMLMGKPLYLRGGWLDDNLNYNENGKLISHSAKGSFTLSAIQIDRVRLLKHKVELDGTRYGIHFFGLLASDDQSSAFDRVRITPKKKVVKITIDREIVVKPKKVKEAKAPKNKKGKPAPAARPAAVKTAAVAAPATASPATTPAPATPVTPAATADAAASVKAPVQPASEPADLSEADQLKASIAATPAAERPADAKSVTTTTSPAHAARLLHQALDTIFASTIDQQMVAAMPDCWKLYYAAATTKSDYQPQDPTVERQRTVEKKARLLSSFEPGSNEYAQANGVSGMALYHVVVGVDGKAREVAVARPIGFGLDENAAAAIRKAAFEPAQIGGKPVPVLLDMVVEFRLYSKMTAAAVAGQAEKPVEKPAEKPLPGPYSVGQQ